MTIQLTYHFDSHEALLNHLGASSNQPSLPGTGEAAAPKKPGRKAAAAAATTAAAPAPTKPAAAPAAKTATKTVNYTADQVKAAVSESIGEVPDFNVQVKAVINSYGVQRVSDMDQATLNQAYADAQKRIQENAATGEVADEEVDPMG